MLDNIEIFSDVDKSNMLDDLVQYPKQIREAIDIAETKEIENIMKIDDVIITGMGASAISGDMVQTLFRDKIEVPVAVNRQYDLPKWAKKDTLTIAGPIYDPVGAIYYLRSLPLKVGDEVSLNIFNGRKVREIIIHVTGKGLVQVPAGTFECLELKPTTTDSRRLTKVDGMLHIWLATDQKRTPVRVEQKTGFGTMVMRLKEAR